MKYDDLFVLVFRKNANASADADHKIGRRIFVNDAYIFVVGSSYLVEICLLDSIYGYAIDSSVDQ